ncbi:uncharacterized protein DS421_14g452110 [Arachis hypogaea]|nr:uncharacterized protein DS421_14g452110 [Arachis hypogaea]
MPLPQQLQKPQNRNSTLCYQNLKTLTTHNRILILKGFGTKTFTVTKEEWLNPTTEASAMVLAAKELFSATIHDGQKPWQQQQRNSNGSGNPPPPLAVTPAAATSRFSLPYRHSLPRPRRTQRRQQRRDDDGSPRMATNLRQQRARSNSSLFLALHSLSAFDNG